MFSNLMDSMATAIRPKNDQDSAQGNTQDFTLGDAGVTTLFKNRACGYQEATGGLEFRYAQRSLAVSNVLLFAQDPGNLAGCQISVTRPKTKDTFKLNYVGQRDPFQIGASWVWPVDCLRVRQPGS